MTGEPERVHVIIERADGFRIARVRAPRWVVSALAAAVGLGLVAGGALYGDYVALTRQRSVFAAVEDRLGRQDALIESQRQVIESQRQLLGGVEAKLRQLRTEVDGWQQIQARLWQPFGPDVGPPVSEPGVGGAAIRHIEPDPEASMLQEELERLAAVVVDTGHSLRALDTFMSRVGQVIASLPSRWPVRGTVNSEYGSRVSPWSRTGEFHSGLDIGAKSGTPVVAPAAGTIAFAGRYGDYGLAVVIDHGNEVRTLYAHLSRLLVEVEQRVQPGAVVAHTGSTGRSSGPHLHYEIQVQGRPVNPRTFLWN